jgi:hypothetical protein
MPGPIKHYKKRPKGMSSKKWKGPGKYYKRSGSAGWSKRTPALDKKRKAKKYKPKKRTSATGTGPYAHLHDQTITKKEYINYKTGRVVKTTTKKTTATRKKAKATASKAKTKTGKAKRKGSKRKGSKRKGRKK